MDVSEKLLDKYFKGQCSAEEAFAVKDYLNKTEQVPDHLLGKYEWDQTVDAEITDIETEEMFNAVKQQTITKIYRLKLIKIASVAAIVIAMLSIGVLSLNKPTEVPKLAENIDIDKKIVNTISWKSVVNYTEQSQLMTLPDNSVVKIYPGGEIRYTLPFVNNKREVYLKGKGFFEVTKDKKHPFVVYAKGISTTALGTSFTITAPSKSKLIKIQLHTGKIWIKDADSTNQVTPFSKILTPGNELVYNMLDNKFQINDTKVLKPEQAIVELEFTQAPLVDVFAKLQQSYKVKITYNPADLQEMSFTGSLKFTHSIDSILEEITSLNKLKYLKITEGYLISK